MLKVIGILINDKISLWLQPWCRVSPAVAQLPHCDYKTPRSHCFIQRTVRAYIPWFYVICLGIKKKKHDITWTLELLLVVFLGVWKSQASCFPLLHVFMLSSANNLQATAPNLEQTWMWCWYSCLNLEKKHTSLFPKKLAYLKTLFQENNKINVGKRTWRLKLTPAVCETKNSVVFEVCVSVVRIRESLTFSHVLFW